MTTDERSDDQDKGKQEIDNIISHFRQNNVKPFNVNEKKLTEADLQRTFEKLRHPQPMFYVVHRNTWREFLNSAVNPNNPLWVDLYRRDDGLRERSKQ